MKRGFADIVKISRNIELLSKVSLIPSTKIRVRSTLSRHVLTERKKRGR